MCEPMVKPMTKRGPGAPRSYDEPPEPRAGLLAARALEFEPSLPTGPGRSRDRELMRALNRWRKGAAPGLRVLHNGRDVSAEQIDWDTVPQPPSSGSPPAEATGTVIRLAHADDEALLERVRAKLRAPSRAAAIREALRRIDEAAE